MGAGELNRRVRIDAPAAGQDDAGQPTDGWLPVAEVWAGIKHQTGLQAIMAAAEVSVVKASIKVRKQVAYSAAMRATDLASGLVYDIKAILPDLDDNAFMYLVCETGANRG